MAYAHQVGGHAATILASPLSSSTLIKPASARELAFYSQLGPALDDGHFVGEWTPAFYGTLRLEGKVGAEGGIDKLDTAGDEAGEVEPEMIVLENLTYRFLHPNVLDIKLGTQLFDEDASDEKKERMRKAAEATTSAETGVRLTGFQVWDAATQAYVPTAKPFGKSLEVEELALGIARFFYPPLSPPSRAEQATSFSSSPAPVPRALPLDLLLPVLRTLTRRLDSLIALWSTLPLRMRGGSLLIVVEGDPAALEAALLRAAAPDSEVDDDGESVSTTDDEGNAKEHTLLPFEMRLIDFAHTRGLLPGEEGPDEGVLLGLRTTKKLIDDLVTHLEEKQRNGDE
ncbi:inositol polyphosphate kinase family protein [Rhodotorula paludigena]|uniref:inositol polyphosphate kinase family protein n=1 Tax=Rhodotorula paludigena TaxID=86838 RepID=UPI0031814F8F